MTVGNIEMPMSCLQSVMQKTAGICRAGEMMDKVGNDRGNGLKLPQRMICYCNDGPMFAQRHIRFANSMPKAHFAPWVKCFEAMRANV